MMEQFDRGGQAESPPVLQTFRLHSWKWLGYWRLRRQRSIKRHGAVDERGVTQESWMTIASVIEYGTYYVERFGGMLSFTLLFAAAFYGFEAVLGRFGVKVGGKPMNTISH
jgi:hypothetical protein